MTADIQARVEAVLAEHAGAEIQTYPATSLQSLHCHCGRQVGWTPPERRAHVAAALADAGLLADDSESMLTRIRALVHSTEADQYRDQACRHTVEQPYADNRYVRLLDAIRAALAGRDA
jgi:hypothetical protein